MKWAMVGRAKKVYGSVRVGGKNAKSVWWNDVVETMVERKVVLL